MPGAHRPRRAAWFAKRRESPLPSRPGASDSREAVAKKGAWVAYPIADDATWGRIVENIAAVVEQLERTSIAEAEALSPAAPAWFAAMV